MHGQVFAWPYNPIAERHHNQQDAMTTVDTEQ